MEITLPSMSDKKWTCADLLSSYRFWGITFFFLVLSFISSLGSSYGVYFWSNHCLFQPIVLVLFSFAANWDTSWVWLPAGLSAV
ncbi:membrane protein [Salmonella enterica subsp. enterica]|uniref:Membrane protein n=1 Tax=Salmonella enterica I TaxID=59201 RepID=A0A379WH63_SALET|nr:membrane protein [Salmonella enterica subsp. enterica]